MKTNHLLLFSICLLAPLACTDEADSETFRTLPVAAQTIDGDEVLVGTYDEATNTLELVPAFVAEIENTSGGLTLDLVADDQAHPFAREGVWPELGEGATLDIVASQPSQQWVGGHLSIHAPGWTDGLTEVEAASSFGLCLDWNCDPCIFDPF